MDIWELIKDIINTGEQKVVRGFYGMKRKLFKLMLELVLMLVGVVFILIGIVMVMDRFFSIEWIFLVTGLILLNFVLITAKFR